MNLNRKGFTLVELMIVICVIGILAGITFPRFISALNGHRYSNSLRDVKGALQLARLTAIKEAIPVTTIFTPGTNSYRVFRDNDGDGAMNGADSLVTDGSMQKDVTLTGTDFNSALGVNITQFNKDGFPVNAASGFFTGLTGDINISSLTTSASGFVNINNIGNITITR